MRDGTFTAIALDPGGTTGIVKYTCEAIYNPLTSKWEYSRRELHFDQLGPQAHHFRLMYWLQLQRVHGMHVVCESFQDRDLDKELISVEYIGVVKAFAQETRNMDAFKDDPFITWQTAAKGKGFWTDEKLKAVNCYTKQGKHARDATRHLLHYLVFELGDQFWLHQLHRAGM